MPYIVSLSAAALSCVVLFATPVRAQTPEPAVPTQPAAPQLDPKACTDRDRLRLGDTVGTAPAKDAAASGHSR